jgi:hypothetical protein
MDVLARLVTNRICDTPLATSSSATYCTIGLRATVSISFGWDFVAGSRRVPKPATGTIALRITSYDYIPSLLRLTFPAVSILL